MNKQRSTRSSSLLGLVALLFAALAFAAPAAAADSKKAEAETHYDQGKAYYKAGAFDLAIQEFLAGYKLDPRPGVLFNIARGYEELKDKPRAIEYYKKYVDLGAAAAAATEARARMVVLERQIKEDEDRKKAEEAERERQRQAALNPPPAMPAPVEAKPAAVALAAPLPAATPASPDAAVSVQAAPAASPESARKLKIAGMATGGAGVVLLGVGAYFALHASGLESDINGEIGRTMVWTPELTKKNSDMESAQTLALVGFVAGGAALAGGAVLYYLGWNKTPHDGASQAMLTPAVGPNGGSLLLTGRF